MTAKTALIITHGFSGSGKSTFTGQLAEKIGALQIRSDIERKRLFGYRAQETIDSGIGIYTPEAGKKLTSTLLNWLKQFLKPVFLQLSMQHFLKLNNGICFGSCQRILGEIFYH